MIIEKQKTSPGYILGQILKGGLGSGNFGHAGRPGQIDGIPEDMRNVFIKLAEQINEFEDQFED